MEFSISFVVRTSQKAIDVRRAGCRNQAIPQVCAFYSPEVGILSAMAIFHQLWRRDAANRCNVWNYL